MKTSIFRRLIISDGSNDKVINSALADIEKRNVNFMMIQYITSSPYTYYNQYLVQFTTDAYDNNELSNIVDTILSKNGISKMN